MSKIRRHNLKILKHYFDQQIRGSKNFELRKLDRDFTIGNEIKMEEIDSTEEFGIYKRTGQSCVVVITSIISGFEGLVDGYGIIGTSMRHETIKLNKEEST